MFLWLRILIHELGHYIVFWVLGYRPRGIWVGRCPSDEEKRLPRPGNRVWFPGDAGYNGGGTVFPPDPKGMMPVLYHNAIVVAGSVADFLFLLSGFAATVAGRAVAMMWLAKKVSPYVGRFANYVPDPFFATSTQVVVRTWGGMLIVGVAIGGIVVAATSAARLGEGDIALLRSVHCSSCGEFVPTDNYCEQCGAPF